MNAIVPTPASYMPQKPPKFKKASDGAVQATRPRPATVPTVKSKASKITESLA